MGFNPVFSNSPFFALAVLTANSALADSVILEPAKDSTMYSEGVLSNGQGDALFAGRTRGTAGTENRRALVQFDLSSIPAGAVIEEAVLRLYVSKTPDEDAGDYVFNIHRLTRNWGEGPSIPDPGQFGGQGVVAEEGDATWSHAFWPADSWTSVGGDYNLTPSAFEVLSGVGIYEWLGELVTADVQGWMDEPSTNFGWILIGDENLPSSARVFWSRHYFNAILRPKLTITYSELASSWAGYPINEDGRSVDTAAFLGWIDVGDGPWVYVYGFGKHIYAPEENITGSGGWVWIGQ